MEGKKVKITVLLAVVVVVVATIAPSVFTRHREGVRVLSDSADGATDGGDEMVSAEELAGDICYRKNEVFGACIVSKNCAKDCIKKGYPMSGKCKGAIGNCYCMKKCTSTILPDGGVGDACREKGETCGGGEGRCCSGCACQGGRCVGWC